MVTTASARRGQPLIALCTILVAWTGVRMLVWTPLFEPVGVGVAQALAPVRPADAVFERAVMTLPQPATRGPLGGFAGATPPQWREGSGVASSRGDGAPLFNLANYTSFNLPRGTARGAGKGVRRKPSDQPPPPPRWSGDGWLLLRGSGGSTAQAPGAASYGASQAGAVLRYRLGQGSARDAYAYMRASFAIDAPGNDREAALGLGIRPVAGLPLRALAEVRVQDSSMGEVRVRPVAAVVTELPWQNLPLGLRGEIYAQAGYAGGRDATPFFDAQAVVDHAVTGLLPSGSDLRVGAGAWAGGQEDATRLDVGPRIAVGLQMGARAHARVALDWRIRVGGNAQPGSGAALTVASSF